MKELKWKNECNLNQRQEKDGERVGACETVRQVCFALFDLCLSNFVIPNLYM